MIPELAISLVLQGTASISMPEAVAIAMDHSPRIRTAQRAVENAQRMQQEARALWWPHIRLAATMGQTNNYASMLALSSTPGGESQDLASLLGQSQTRYLSSRLSISQSLLDWQAGNTIDAAGLEAQVAHELLKSARRELASSVASAYLDLYTLHQNRFLKDKVLRTAQSQFAATCKLEARGTLSGLDVKRAEARFLEVELDRKSTDRGVRRAEMALSTLLGLTADQHFSLSAPALAMSEPLPSLSEAVSKALSQRPDLRIAQLQVEQQKLRLDSDQHAQWPTLALSASGGTLSSSAMSTNAQASWWDATRPDMAVTTTLSWNLFDGGRAGHRAARTELEIQNKQEAANQLKQQILLDVEQRLLDAQEAVERLELATKRSEIASLTQASLRIRFKQGLETELALMETDLALSQADESLAAARHVAYAARLRLALAIGEESW